MDYHLGPKRLDVKLRRFGHLRADVPGAQGLRSHRLRFNQE
jgi:hypothetical protein